MRILVTGTEGYLGHVFAPTLLAAGHEVIGVDTGFYREAQLYRGVDRQAHTLFKDIRRVTVADLEGVDAIVHMAELSNDPVGELSPTITYDINHKGSVHLARLAKQAGVAAIRLHVLVLGLRRGVGLRHDRGRSHQSTDRLRRMQGHGRA